MKKRLLYGFLFVIGFHIATKNIYLLLSDVDQIKYVYWSMTSATYLFAYILLFFALKDISRELKIITSVWLAFPINDLIDELTHRGTWIVHSEYFAFMLAVVIVIIEIYWKDIKKVFGRMRSDSN